MDDFFPFGDDLVYEGQLITLPDLLYNWPGCSEEELIIHIMRNELTAYYKIKEVFIDYEDKIYDEDGRLVSAGYEATKIRKVCTKLLSRPLKNLSIVFTQEEIVKIEQDHPTYLVDIESYNKQTAQSNMNDMSYSPPPPEVVEVWEKAAARREDKVESRRLIVALRCSQDIKNVNLANEMHLQNITRDRREGLALGKKLGLPPLPTPPDRKNRRK